ncbi:putative oxidoreductase [Hordeum vulgare]|nr:putative oxidoreductase [Hordeum vulgare]
MINGNEDMAEMDYELKETTTFVIGTTSDPNPSKKKRKSKTAKTAVVAILYHEVEKKPFAFSYCWFLWNGKPKWTQVVAEPKASKKRNDGSSLHQSIGLDDEDYEVFVRNGRAIVPKHN